MSEVAHAADAAGKAVSVSGDVKSGTGKGAQHGLKPGDSIYPGEAIRTGANGSAKVLMTDRTIVDISPSTQFKVDEYQLNNGGDRKVSLSMNYGKIRALVNQPVGAKGKFTVKTKTATMGVRGTEFVVASNSSDSGGGAGSQRVDCQITVVNGKVDVADAVSGRPVQLTPGQQITTTAQVSSDGSVRQAPGTGGGSGSGNGSGSGGGGSSDGGEKSGPKVVELGTEGAKAVAKDTKVEDSTTFKQAVVVEAKNDSGSSGGPSNQQNSPPPAPGSGGNSTVAAVKASVASEQAATNNAPPPPPPAVVTPGTFGATPPPPPTNPVLPGLPVSVQVVFTP